VLPRFEGREGEEKREGKGREEREGRGKGPSPLEKKSWRRHCTLLSYDTI